MEDYFNSNTTLVKVKYTKKILKGDIQKIQIQHLLKLNLTTCKYIITTSTNSNTTLVKVKFNRDSNKVIFRVFKYNTC